jgi:hypothetical protein
MFLISRIIGRNTPVKKRNQIQHSCNENDSHHEIRHSYRDSSAYQIHNTHYEASTADSIHKSLYKHQDEDSLTVYDLHDDIWNRSIIKNRKDKEKRLQLFFELLTNVIC